jgi:hypothetical protein
MQGVKESFLVLFYINPIYNAIKYVDHMPRPVMAKLGLRRDRDEFYAKPWLHQARFRHEKVDCTGVPSTGGEKKLVEDRWQKVSSANLLETSVL